MCVHHSQLLYLQPVYEYEPVAPVSLPQTGEQEQPVIPEQMPITEEAKPPTAYSVSVEPGALTPPPLPPQYYYPGSPIYNYTAEEMRELRKSIESSGNYNTYTGNGMVGAYQFNEQYMAERMERWGLGPYNREQFLNDPALQDAAADAYASEWYGGWENTPTSGGW